MGQIENIALLILSLGLGLSSTLMSNRFMKRHLPSGVDCLRFNALSSLSSVVVLMIVMLFTTGLQLPSLYTVGMALIYGVLTALGAFFGVLALRYGSVSYTSVLGSSSMVIPALSGMVFWKEIIRPVQWVGIVLMLCSFVLAVNRDPGDTKGYSRKWFHCCVVSALCSGCIGILQKVHQSSSHASELSAFLIVSFLFFTAVSGGRGVWSKNVQEKPSRVSVKVVLLFAMYGGFCAAMCNQINMYLSGALPSIVFFPIVNGVGLLLSIAAGILLLKERFTRRQTLGMIFGAAAVLLLCGIF